MQLSRWGVAVLMLVGMGAMSCMASLVVGMGMPPQCSPEVLDEIDNPKIREICHFLQTYAEAVEQGGTSGAQFLKGGGHFPLGLIDNGVKRQDVDHVFLRFGRRRR